MSRILDTLSGPRDLRQLPVERLPALAKEVRQTLAKTSPLRDAYRASALGLTELTIAMHYVYDFAADALIFDMAHQSAAHMLLTRPDRPAAAAIAGLAPDPGDRDSAYDHFVAVHAGTSISTALGMAAGRSDGSKTVAVIGDGAIVSGIALEALNSGGGLDRDVLVILNDNEMSPSKVMGSLGEYLAKIRVGKTYTDLKRDVHKLFQSIPFIGETLNKTAEQLKEAIAKALVPGHLFESLGPRYFGPVDGHNTAHLVQLLREIRRQHGFYLLHVVTKRDRDHRDGGRSNRSSAESLVVDLEFKRQGEEHYSAAFAKAAAAALERDPGVVVVSAGAPEDRTLRALKDRLVGPLAARHFDVDICEQHGLAFAAGLARAGRRVITAIPSSYLQRGYDQVFQECAINGLPLLFCVFLAGFADEQTSSRHGLYDIAYLRALPEVDVWAPRDARELRAMIDLGLTAERPTVIRFPAAFAPHDDLVFPEHAELARGRAEILRRGSDIGVFAFGATVFPAMEAADLLAEKGIEATVVNARFARPIDAELLARVLADHTLTFTVEEHGLAGGFGAAVLETAARDRLGAGKLVPVAVADQYFGSGGRPALLRAAGLDPASLADRLLFDYRRHVRSPSRP